MGGARRVNGPSWTQRQAETQPNVSHPLEVTTHTDVVTPTPSSKSVCARVCMPLHMRAWVNRTWCKRKNPQQNMLVYMFVILSTLCVVGLNL